MAGEKNTITRGLRQQRVYEFNKRPESGGVRVDLGVSKRNEGQTEFLEGLGMPVDIRRWLAM